jgi:hypothetical protein
LHLRKMTRCSAWSIETLIRPLYNKHLPALENRNRKTFTESARTHNRGIVHLPGWPRHSSEQVTRHSDNAERRPGWAWLRRIPTVKRRPLKSHERIVAISDFGPAGGPEPGVLRNGSSLVASVHQSPSIIALSTRNQFIPGSIGSFTTVYFENSDQFEIVQYILPDHVTGTRDLLHRHAIADRRRERSAGPFGTGVWVVVAFHIPLLTTVGL